MPTLYRKYRPQKFADLVGQDHLVKTLTNEISTAKIAHAYLFSGPRGIGKTTMARLLAKAINCENRKDSDFEPCDECASCKEISAARNIDVIEIDAASNTGVDNVRENIIDNAQFKPTKSKYKVFIIDEVHMLSSSSFNALLKTLEEPPAHVIFVLATTELHKLPATIISRCQRFNFKKIPEDIMMKKLAEIADDEKVKIDKEVLKRIIIKSDGCMRDAESLLGQIMSLNLKKISSDDAAQILPTADIESALLYLQAIADKHAADAITVLDKIVKEGASIDQFALDVIDVLRAAMIAEAGSSSYGLDYTEKDRKQVVLLAKTLGKNLLILLIDSALKRRSEIRQSPVPQLPLELLAVEFGSNDDSKTNFPPHTNHPAANDQSKNNSDTVPAALSREIQTNTAVITETAAKVTETSPGSLNIDEVKAKWLEAIIKLSENFHSLVFVLKMADITGVEGNKFSFTLPYSFHKEKVEDKKCRRAIEEAMSELLNRRVMFSCIVKEQGTNTVADNELAGIAAEFGGEVVA
ncbi:MAG: DNA polymerase III subunit gamma/tau [Candidatus Magasanikbacteria bacterium]|nr:DNA polymerase III subunit gamma/tau [Candidatus Magasanikbacteria bacterium]